MKPVLILSVLLACVAHVSATHFRYHYGETQTTVVDNTVTIRVVQAWRRSAFGNPNVGDSFSNFDFLNWGDGSSTQLTFIATAQDNAEDWVLGETTLTHLYTTPGLKTISFFTCCRISTLVIDPDTSALVETQVFIGVNNRGPTTSLPPIVAVARSADPFAFQFVASDADGNPLTYAFADETQNGGVHLPPGIAIDPNTGVVTWLGRQAQAEGLYAVQVRITEHTSAGPLVSSVDFLIRLTDQQTNNVPIFVPPTPAVGSVSSCPVGVATTFSLKATDADGDVITLAQTGIPVTAVFSSVPAPAVVTGTIVVTPAAADLGDTLSFAVTVTDPHGASSFVTFFCTVVPVGPGEIIGDPQFVGFQGQSYQVHGIPDEYFSLISTPHFYVNSHFVYLSNGVCNYNETLCFSHPGTYVDQLGFGLKGVNVTLMAGSHARGLSLWINDRDLTNAGPAVYVLPASSTGTQADCSVTVVTRHKVTFTCDMITFTAINSDLFFNMEVALTDTKILKAGSKRVKMQHSKQVDTAYPSIPIHGLLGQTWKNIVYDSHHVIEGSHSDYVTGALFNPSFLYNKYLN